MTVSVTLLGGGGMSESSLGLGHALGAALGVEQIIAKLDEFAAFVAGIRVTFVSRFASEASDVFGPVSEAQKQAMTQWMSAWAEGQRLLGTNEPFPLPASGDGRAKSAVLTEIGKMRDALARGVPQKPSSGLSTRAKIGIGVGGAAVVGLIIVAATRKPRPLAGARRRR